MSGFSERPFDPALQRNHKHRLDIGFLPSVKSEKDRPSCNLDQRIPAPDPESKYTPSFIMPIDNQLATRDQTYPLSEYKRRDTRRVLDHDEFGVNGYNPEDTV